MEIKQTAVDWFFDKLENHEMQAKHYKLFQQAKQMMEEQISNGYFQGLIDGMNNSPRDYYNETYKQPNNEQ